MRSVIVAELERIAREHEVRILWAIESGSRAWGFASPDSDYDVRFIYIHRPTWYMGVERGRDVIEEMISSELDFAGWDLTKALLLLRKSNPSLLEWIGSPIVYQSDPKFIESFKALAGECVSLRSCMSHYLHMSSANWNTYFKDPERAQLKKYLYVIRPLLACQWVERFGTSPPVEFFKLVEATNLPPDVKQELDQLLRAKAETAEAGDGPRRPALDAYIASEHLRIADLALPRTEQVTMERLDSYFKDCLGVGLG